MRASTTPASAITAQVIRYSDGLQLLVVGTGGNDTITATTLGLTATQAVAVSSQNFVINPPAANAKSDCTSW